MAYRPSSGGRLSARLRCVVGGFQRVTSNSAVQTVDCTLCVGVDTVRSVDAVIKRLGIQTDLNGWRSCGWGSLVRQ